MSICILNTGAALPVGFPEAFLVWFLVLALPLAGIVGWREVSRDGAGLSCAMSGSAEAAFASSARSASVFSGNGVWLLPLSRISCSRL